MAEFINLKSMLNSLFKFNPEIFAEIKYWLSLQSTQNAGFSVDNSLIIQKLPLPPPAAIYLFAASKRVHIQYYPLLLLLPQRHQPAPSEESPRATSPSNAASTTWTGTPCPQACSSDPDSSPSLHWQGHPCCSPLQIGSLRASKGAGTPGWQ